LLTATRVGTPAVNRHGAGPYEIRILDFKILSRGGAVEELFEKR